MNKTAIQIKMIALWTVILLFTACQDDVPFRNADRIQEGIPTTVKLGFQASEATVETRAAQDQKYEDRVDNVFILIFDEDGNIHDRFFCKPGSGLSYDDGNDLKSSGILTFTTTSLNNATIVGIANLADGNTSTAYTVTEDGLKAVTTLNGLKAKMMTMRDESVYRSAYFMMTGYAKVKKPADGTDPTLINIPALESDKTATLECTLELERTDAKVKFVVTSEVPKGKDWKEFSFQPTGWTVKRVPRQSLILPKDAADEKGNWDFDGDTAVYFNSPSYEFETFSRNGALYKGGSFVFYMPENRKKYKQEITGDIDIHNIGEFYALRDKRENSTTDEDGNVTLGDFEYANANSTYVEITGILSYFERKDGVDQLVYANVRFLVHLGYANGFNVKDFVNDYDTKRNHSYTYNVKVKGVHNIEVDVNDEIDPRPGYDGDVVVNYQDSYQFDCHYDRRLIKLNISGFKPKEGGTAGTLRWGVSTPFSKGIHEVVANAADIKQNMRDYRWIKFAVNKEYGVANDKMVKYPGDQNYNDPFPLDHTKNNKPSPYYSPDGDGYKKYGTVNTAEARLRDVNQLMQFLKEEAETNSNGIFADDGYAYITAFVDENVYAYDPRTNVQDLTLWKKMAETDDRQLYIIVDEEKYSEDNQSSVIKAQYSFRQRSVRTVYNVNKPELQTAWGLESNMETERLYAGTIKNGVTTDKSNGRLNTLRILLGNNYQSSPAKLKWTDVLNTSDVFSESEYYGLKSGYEYAIYACLIRNRDLNGNNIVDADEIRWYLASINQLVDIYLGEYALDALSRLYPTDAVDRPGGNSVYWHYTSSSYDGQVSNPWVLWAEEGASLGRKNDSQLEKYNGPFYSYRCLRNLGIPLDQPDQEPADLVSVHQIEATRGYQIDVTNMNEKSRRPNFETALAAHNERQQDNRPYAYFEVHPNYYGGSYNNRYTWQYYQTNNPCPTGYRIPNQRELLIMSTRLPSTAWDSWYEGGYYMSQTAFSLMGKPPYTKDRVGFIWHNAGNFLLVNGGETGVVRPVKDITSITAN